MLGKFTVHSGRRQFAAGRRGGGGSATGRRTQPTSWGNAAHRRGRPRQACRDLSRCSSSDRSTSSASRSPLTPPPGPGLPPRRAVPGRGPRELGNLTVRTLSLNPLRSRKRKIPALGLHSPRKPTSTRKGSLVLRGSALTTGPGKQPSQAWILRWRATGGAALTSQFPVRSSRTKGKAAPPAPPQTALSGSGNLGPRPRSLMTSQPTALAAGPQDWRGAVALSDDVTTALASRGGAGSTQPWRRGEKEDGSKEGPREASPRLGTQRESRWGTGR